LASNGNDAMPPIAAIRGSFITFALMRSRAARERKTMYENSTTSSRLSLTACGNDVSLPGLTSSATHSRNASAPCSIHILPAFAAIRR
jgi:hypothetical protein